MGAHSIEPPACLGSTTGVAAADPARVPTRIWLETLMISICVVEDFLKQGAGSQVHIAHLPTRLLSTDLPDGFPTLLGAFYTDMLHFPSPGARVCRFPGFYKDLGQRSFVHLIT